MAHVHVTVDLPASVTLDESDCRDLETQFAEIVEDELSTRVTVEFTFTPASKTTNAAAQIVFESVILLAKEAWVSRVIIPMLDAIVEQRGWNKQVDWELVTRH